MPTIAPDPRNTNGELVERPPVAGSETAMAHGAPVGSASLQVDAPGNVGWQALVPVLTSLVTGAALLGFVALVGGAVEWTRASKAGLPPAESVSFMSRASLLANGAELLVPALGVVLVAVGALWAAGEVARRTCAKSCRNKIDAAKEDVAEKERADLAAEKRLDAVNQKHKRLSAEREQTQEPGLAELVRSAADELVDASRERESAEGGLEKARLNLEKAEFFGDRLGRAARGGALAVVLFGGMMWMTAVWVDDVSVGHFLVLVLLAVVGVLFTLAVNHERDSFPRLAVSAFVAVGVFLGLATSFSLRDHPEVEPAAALIDDLRPIEGLYVTQTSDGVYLGVPSGDGYDLVALPRNKVRGLSVGALTGVGDATAESARLAEELCSVSRAEPPAKHAPRC